MLRPRLSLIALLMLAGTGLPATAACPSVPDGPDTANVAAGAARTACLQNELARASELLRQQTEFRSLVQEVDRLELQQKLALPPPPMPVFVPMPTPML